MRNRTKIFKTPFPHPCLLPGLNCTPISLPPAPEQRRGTGNGGYGQFITRCLCCSFLLRGRTPHTPPRLQREVPRTGHNPPQAAPTSLLPTGCSSLRTATVWVPSMGCSPSGTGCSSVGPPGVTSPASKPAPAWSPLSTGPQVLAEACSRVDSLQGHSLLQASTSSSMGSSTGYRWISAPPWTSMGCRRTTCLTVVFTTSCRGISSLVPGAPQPSPASLPLVSAVLFLPHSLTPLFLGCSCEVLFTFLNILSQRHYHRH